MNSHYSPILHGCMNTKKGRAKFKKFQILLDSGCSSMIVIIRLVEKLSAEKDAVVQWQTYARNITTNFKFQVYVTLPALSATNAVIWKCHVDDSSRDMYDMILGSDMLTDLVLNLKISEHVIKVDDDRVQLDMSTFSTCALILGYHRKGTLIGQPIFIYFEKYMSQYTIYSFNFVLGF